MKHIKEYEEFLFEKSYDIKVNNEIETISDNDIKDYIEDGYTNLTGIVDQFLQVLGYEYEDVKDWDWKNSNDEKTIKKKFKL
jgi:hypothetical protein